MSLTISGSRFSQGVGVLVLRILFTVCGHHYSRRLPFSEALTLPASSPPSWTSSLRNSSSTTRQVFNTKRDKIIRGLNNCLNDCGVPDYNYTIVYPPNPILSIMAPILVGIRCPKASCPASISERCMPQDTEMLMLSALFIRRAKRQLPTSPRALVLYPRTPA